jgi:hypothetical protein
MSMRDKIAHIIINDHDQRISAASTADAILRALPDMIAPLVWEEVDKFTFYSGSYKIYRPPFEVQWHLFFGEDWVQDHQDKDVLGVKANTHHRDAIMATFTGNTK